MGQQRQALPRRAGRACSPCRPGTGGRSWPRRPATPGRASSAYFPLWTYAHPTAIELAGRLAALAPGNLNRVFFTTGGGEAVESAWKLARQYFARHRPAAAHKVIARDLAYHGTTMGALSITGLAADPGAVRAAGARRVPRRQHQPLPLPLLLPSAPACTLACADEIEAAIVREEPETVAAVYLEPVQNAGGCFTPVRRLLRPGARDLRPLRRAARVRRGDLRVRPARRDVRRPSGSATSPT